MLTLHRVSYPWAGPKSCPAGAGCSRLSLSRSRTLFRQGGIGHIQHSTAVFQRGLSLPRFNDEEICMCPQVSVPQQFYSIPWNTFNRDVLKSLYSFAPISMHCNKSSAVRFPVGTASLPKLPNTISRCKGHIQTQQAQGRGLELPGNPWHEQDTEPSPALSLDNTFGAHHGCSQPDPIRRCICIK